MISGIEWISEKNYFLAFRFGRWWPNWDMMGFWKSATTFRSMTTGFKPPVWFEWFGIEIGMFLVNHVL